MAVVKGQALRRREGQAPNTLVMAETATVDGTRSNSIPCPIQGCKRDETPDTLDSHLALSHPRHRLGEEARRRMLYAAGL